MREKHRDALGRGHRVYGRRPHAYHGAPPRETVETLSLPQVQTDARDYYVNFRDAQQGGREPAVTHRQMLAVMRVIDAIFVSAKEHRAVKPEE